LTCALAASTIAPVPIASTPQTEICYETTGDPTNPAVILIMGLGGQLIAWDDEFCGLLAARNLFVIRFDNRDAGFSTSFDDADLDLSVAFAAAMAGRPIDVPYSLSDMAGDTRALMDHLHIDRAHLVGVSMGGMIAQTLAAESPDRVTSLTSIMSSTGDRAVGQPSAEALAALFDRPPNDRAAAIEASVRAQKVIGGATHFDEERARQNAAAAFDRAFNPEGTGRQLAAIYSAGNRSAQIAGIAAPTLVIHGEQDSLIHVSGGHHTAELVPDARLLVLDEMGHDLPPPLWNRLIDELANHFREAEEKISR
jgi:pimeloyl-ACP methyl ester carboxylesterase